MKIYLHSDESKLGAAELGGITRNLLLDLPALVSNSVVLVAEIPDPVLHSHSAANGIIVTAENKDVKVESALNEVLVNGDH